MLVLDFCHVHVGVVNCSNYDSNFRQWLRVHLDGLEFSQCEESMRLCEMNGNGRSGGALCRFHYSQSL